MSDRRARLQPCRKLSFLAIEKPAFVRSATNHVGTGALARPGRAQARQGRSLLRRVISNATAIGTAESRALPMLLKPLLHRVLSNGSCNWDPSTSLSAGSERTKQVPPPRTLSNPAMYEPVVPTLRKARRMGHPRMWGFGRGQRRRTRVSDPHKHVRPTQACPSRVVPCIASPSLPRTPGAARSIINICPLVKSCAVCIIPPMRFRLIFAIKIIARSGHSFNSTLLCHKGSWESRAYGHRRVIESAAPKHDPA
jgi:hypothetical protein